MAYEINFTDSVNKGSITVEDRSINNETSLQLTGRNLTDYGAKINENFLHLLENFANNTSPANPVEGQLWYDNTTGVDQLKIYDGSNWVSAGGLKKSSSPPAAEQSLVGDLWVDTSNQQLYLFSGSGWTLIGPDFAEGINTGTKFENITDTTNVARPCLINYVNGKAVSIISSSAEFTPKLTIPGYGKIYPGHNVSSNIDGAVGKYWGTSQKAETLFVNNTVGALGGAEFARLNSTNIFTQPIRVRNNNGLDVGETQTLVLSVTGGSNALITNKSNDGYIALRVQNNTTAIRIKNDGKVGILNESPQEELDVTGNALISGSLKNNSTTESTSISTGSFITSGGAGIAKNINVGGNASIAGDIEAANILPDITNARNIGSVDLKYNNIYANNFRGNILGDVVGNVTGSAGSAAKLNSTTSFSITGDVSTSSPVTFDGQTGGLTKTFSVSLNDTFFTGKDDYTDNISGTEEVLIRKTTLETGDAQDINRFYVTTVEDITSTIPTFAIGMVMPYAGATAPSGWRLCNGDAISVASADFAPLYAVIGFTYGGSLGSGVFNLPDLRGRFPVGYMAGVSRTLATDEDRLYDDGAANILGADGGAQRRWITKDNLPEHQHSLMGDAGTQFYATTGVTGVSDSNTAGINITGGNPGTGLEITEGVDGLVTSTQTIDGVPEVVGEKFTTVPPFLALNFIIYTGVV
jgi:microcystin-dependent protein